MAPVQLLFQSTGYLLYGGVTSFILLCAILLLVNLAALHNTVKLNVRGNRDML